MSHPFRQTQASSSQVDQAELAMQLCALADGELSEQEYEQLMQQLDALPDGDAALRTWAHYHLLGECLRGDAGLAQVPSATSALGFVHGLRERLALEQEARAFVVPQPAPARDGVDPLDPELFAIFEEEGAQLLSQLKGALQHWIDAPNAADAAQAHDQVLSVLRTLRGSARLIGAVQIGDMAEQLEGDARALDAKADAQQLLSLMQRCGSLQTAFESLRHNWAGAVAQDAPSQSVLPSAAQVGEVAAAGAMQAANASVFRWKMVAGVASVAAVAVLSWNGVQRFSGGGDMRLAGGDAPASVASTASATAVAATASPPATALIGSSLGVMQASTAPAQNLASADGQASGPLRARANAGSPVMIRDPKLDELLMRHYGHPLGLQSASPFVHNASVQQPGR